MLLDDPWADRLVIASERESVRSVVGGKDLDAGLRAHPSYGTVILRARYAEDVLAAVVAGGVRQYVIIGAGMDSFALRCPAFAADLEIFEIDHPMTQRFKTRRLEDCGIALPRGLHLVPADLSEIALDAALASTSFCADRRTFFSWLGVTPYLTRKANLTTLRAVAACAAVESELVLSYFDQRIFDLGPKDAIIKAAGAALGSAGEPWVSGFHPSQLAGELHDAGFELVETMGPDQLRSRYCLGRSDGLAPTPSAYVAHARVNR